MRPIRSIAAALGLLASLVLSADPVLPAPAPSYADPSTFIEREVVIGTAPWVLPATVTLPRQAPPWPGVVLVHGSGPHDRDETIGPNKPFRDVALGLATRGIAVLRYDKRTLVYRRQFQALLPAYTVNEETIEDALTAVLALRRIEGVSSGQVYVLGHSLGAMLAPRIAARDPAIAGLILAAAPARPIDELILEQLEYVINVDGIVSDAERNALAEIRRHVARIRDPNLSAATPARELLGVPASYWLDLRGYDPVVAARSIQKPFLILHGGRDYQVTSTDFSRWQQGLSGKMDVTFRFYPNLNHLFMPGEGKSTPAEYEVPGHVGEALMVDIAAWIRR